MINTKLDAGNNHFGQLRTLLRYLPPNILEIQKVCNLVRGEIEKRKNGGAEAAPDGPRTHIDVKGDNDAQGGEGGPVKGGGIEGGVGQAELSGPHPVQGEEKLAPHTDEGGVSNSDHHDNTDLQIAEGNVQGPAEEDVGQVEGTRTVQGQVAEGGGKQAEASPPPHGRGEDNMAPLNDHGQGGASSELPGENGTRTAEVNVQERGTDVEVSNGQPRTEGQDCEKTKGKNIETSIAKQLQSELAGAKQKNCNLDKKIKEVRTELGQMKEKIKIMETESGKHREALDVIIGGLEKITTQIVPGYEKKEKEADANTVGYEKEEKEADATSLKYIQSMLSALSYFFAVYAKHEAPHDKIFEPLYNKSYFMLPDGKTKTNVTNLNGVKQYLAQFDGPASKIVMTTYLAAHIRQHNPEQPLNGILTPEVHYSAEQATLPTLPILTLQSILTANSVQNSTSHGGKKKTKKDKGKQELKKIELPTRLRERFAYARYLL